MSNYSVPIYAFKALSANVEKAMASLYGFQKSLVDAYGKTLPGVFEEFSDLKGPLRENWEQCITFLQRCHIFGGDINTLNEVIGNPERVEECSELLTEMKRMSEELVRHSERLRLDSIDNSKKLEIYASRCPAQLKKQLSKRTDTLISNDLARKFSIEHLLEKFFSVQSPRTDTQRSAVDRDLSRGGALAEAKTALDEISSSLSAIHQFWETTYRAFETFIAGHGHESNRNNSIATARRLVRFWDAYQTASTSTIASLAKSCDAFAVDAIGVPPRPAPQPPACPKAPPFAITATETRRVTGGTPVLRSLPHSGASPPLPELPLPIEEGHPEGVAPISSTAGPNGAVSPRLAGNPKTPAQTMSTPVGRPTVLRSQSTSDAIQHVKPQPVRQGSATGEDNKEAKRGRSSSKA